MIVGWTPLECVIVIVKPIPLRASHPVGLSPDDIQTVVRIVVWCRDGVCCAFPGII